MNEPQPLQWNLSKNPALILTHLSLLSRANIALQSVYIFPTKFNCFGALIDTWILGKGMRKKIVTQEKYLKHISRFYIWKQ